LEAEISNLKDKIKEKEKRRNDSANRTTPSQTKPTHTSDPSGKSSKPTAEEGWTLVDRRRKTRKPTFEKIKLVICGMDNGHRNLTELKAEFNKDDITHKVMAKYIKWEHQNRQLLQQRGHRSGGVCITVFNRQDADLLIRKGIRAYGQRYQIKPFSRASLTDDVKIVINMVTWKDHASWKNLLTEVGRGNNRKITDSIRAIRQTAHPMHHGGESPTAQLPEVS
jgi:hypothetical protein